MPLADVPGLVAGAVALGVAHGVEPGHGWPVAATYALDKSATWFYGFAASFVLGVGHLVSSVAMVAAFYLAKSYFGLAQVNEPVALGPVEIGGPVGIVAGLLLIALGVREYRHGHSHGHGGDGHSHDHGHRTGNPVVDLADDDHLHDHGHGHEHSDTSHGHSRDHSHGHEHSDTSHGHSRDHSHDHGEQTHDHSHPDHDHSHDSGDGWLASLKTALPFVGGHAHGSMDEAADRGLWGIAGFAFLLGFAHEEEFEIIAICAGSRYCIELMLVYALTVIGGIVALTLLLVAGYTHYEERVSAYAEYLPLFSATVLVLMGLGFVSGLF